MENEEKVKYNFYRHFNNLYDTKNEENITTLNLGAFGAWNIMKNTNLTNLNLNGLYSLFYSINNTMLPTIINLGNSYTLFKTIILSISFIKIDLLSQKLSKIKLMLANFKRS